MWAGTSQCPSIQIIAELRVRFSSDKSAKSNLRKEKDKERAARLLRRLLLSPLHSILCTLHSVLFQFSSSIPHHPGPHPSRAYVCVPGPYPPPPPLLNQSTRQSVHDRSLAPPPEVDSLGQGQRPRVVDGAGAPAHVLLPGVAPRLPPAARLLLAAEGAAFFFFFCWGGVGRVRKRVGYWWRNGHGDRRSRN